MNKKLSKIGLLLIAILNCPYVLFLISGLKPNPVTNKIVAENTWFAIITSVILILLCVAGLFVKERHIDKYRKCSKLFAGLRVVAGEFGVFWFTFYEVWKDAGVTNPLSIFAELDKHSLFLGFGIILFLFSLPLMGHVAALMCFEYGLEKEKRMKILNIYKILLICLPIIALIGIAVSGAVLYSQYVH